MGITPQQAVKLIDRVMTKELLDQLISEVRGFPRSRLIRCILDHIRVSYVCLSASKLLWQRQLENFTTEELRAKCFCGLILKRLNSLGLLSIDMIDVSMEYVQDLMTNFVGVEIRFEDFKQMCDGFIESNVYSR